MKILIIFRIILLLTLLVFSCFIFGKPSYEMYNSRRIVASEEKVEFNKDKPPAIVVAHIPLDPPHNYEKIETCKETYNTSLSKAVDCINNNLSTLTDILQTSRLFKNQINSSGELLIS